MERKSNTNYRTRLKLLKSGLPRLVIRKTNNIIMGQIIEYKNDGDATLDSVYGPELKKYGWLFSTKNTPASYLLGFLLSKKSKCKEAVVDKGQTTLKKDSFVYYFMKGAQDGGIDLHSSELPISEDRMFGKHISGYVNTSGKQFSKIGAKTKDIKDDFNKVLENIKNMKTA